MLMRKPTFYEITSIVITSFFGILALAGTIKIIISPTVTSWIALSTLGSLLLAWAGKYSYGKIKEKRIYPYYNYLMEFKTDFSISPDSKDGNKLIEAKIHLENHYKSESNLKERIEIVRSFSDSSKEGLELFKEYGTHVKIKSNFVGEYEPSIDECLYYHDIWLSLNLKEPIRKGESFIIIEDFKRIFKSDHLRFFAIHPSGPKNIRLIFREIKPINVYFKKQIGYGILEKGSLQVEEQQDGIFVLTFSWLPSRLGETLYIHWSWPSLVSCQPCNIV